MEQLIEMGFTDEQVGRALDATNGNFELAVDYLLSANQRILPQEQFQGSSCNSTVVQLDVSQYSFPGGVSACTVIATTVLIFLLLNYGNRSKVIDVSKLTEAVFDGVDYYTNNLSAQSTQHLAVDELGGLIAGRIRSISSLPIQGMTNNSNAFSDMIQQCRANADRSKCMGIIVTKPPETICIVIPPESAAIQTCYFFDSHSRPQLGLENSYLVETSSVEALLDRLNRLFPSMDGIGTNNVFESMYNMFEAHPFQM